MEYVVSLTNVYLVSDDFQTFFNNQLKIFDLLTPAVISKSSNI